MLTIVRKRKQQQNNVKTKCKKFAKTNPKQRRKPKIKPAQNLEN